jgi:hypothetical protein
MLFVGRRGPVAELSAWLQEETASKDPVRLGSISGAGGIGKSFLLEHCLRNTPQFSLDEQLVLRFEGQQQPRSLVQLFAVEALAQLDARHPPLPQGQFTRLRELAHQYKRMMGQLEQSALTSGEEGLRDVLQGLLRFGLSPERALPLRPFELAFVSVNETTMEEAIRWLREQRGLRPEWQLWSRPDAWQGKGLRNRLRRDLNAVLSDALLHGLNTLFQHKRRPFRQLLLIFDDYESLSPIVGDFLVDDLLPRLKSSNHPSLLLFLGRDPLLATHPEWGQHYRTLLGTRQIELRPFTRLEADEFIRRKGLLHTEVIERVWERTQGFPFLLDIECDDEKTGGTSALGLKLFYQRLTRWMTPIQRCWLLPLCFLEEINLETISVILPDTSAETVMAWFKEEASLRDPHAARWQVIPFVRQRLLQYVRNDSPQQYARWEALGKHAQQGKSPA